MAHLERLQKSFEALKIVQVTSRLERVAFDKAHPPIRLLKNEAQLGKNEFIQHCNTITESICSPLIRNHDGFLRLLTLACETLLILADDDDTDVRLVANDSLDKICLTYESNLSRIIYVLYREIEKNGSSRSLRVALSKFADLVGFIRPAKYRAYINKLFPCVARIVTTRADDELLQETLYGGFLARVAPTLVPYASEREITSLLAAYLPNLNCGANLVRRSAALALVALCSHARRPQFCFKWLLGNSLNMLSLVKVSTTTNSAAISNPANSSEVVSSERIFSGIFVLAKFLCPKVMRLLNTDNIDGDVLSGGGGGGGKGGGPSGISAEDYEILFDNMVFLYQHLLTSLKYSTSSVVIVAALEALLEYVLSMPGSVYRRIASLGEGGDGQQQSSARTPSSLNINLSRSPTALSGGGGPLTSASSSRMGRDHLDRHRYESNLSITSSINYIENINDEQFTASSSVADEDGGGLFLSGSEKRKAALSRHSGSAALLDGSSSSGDHHQQQNSFSYSFDDRRSVTTADGGFAGGGGGTGSEFGDNESTYFGGGGGGDDAVFSEVNFDADSNSNNSEMNSEFGGDYHHRQMTFDEDVLSETYSSQKSPLLYAELAAAEGGGGSSNSQSGSSSAIDQFNLGPLYSLEYASKLLCLKFLLAGRRGQLMADEAVRVSIKSLALSTFAALVHVYPEALLLGVEGSGDKDEEGENASGEDGEQIPSSNYQPFTDVLLYSTHSDPNLKGAVALLLGKFFDKLLSSPEPYSEFLSRHCQTETNSTDVQLGTLFSLLRRLATDQSTAIAVKQAIAAFALFLPKLITNVGGGGGGGDQQHQQLSGEEVLATLRELVALKDHPYWLVKVELVGVLAALPYNALAYLEKNCCSLGNRNKTLPVSLQQTILEEVVLPFSLDGDHRVRQATVGCLGTMVAGSLCLNSYLLNSDPVNVATFTWMLDNYHQRHSSGLLDLGSRPFLFADARTVSRPLDNGGKEEDEQNEDLHFPHQIESTFSLPLLGQLQHSLLSSNLHYFVRHYVHQLRTAYHRKQSLAGVVGAMATLAKRFPPSRYAEGWHIGGGVGSDVEHSAENNSSSAMNSGLSTATLLVELLTKSGSTMVDLPTHQHLLTLTADLLEGIVCQQAKRLQEKYCTSNAVSSSASSATTPPLRSYPSVPTSESAFFASISPTFSALTQAFFLHLLKVLVAHAAIAEDNPAIFVTFIHNLHSKHHHHQLSSLLKSSTSSGSSSGGKRPGSATSASSKGGHFGGRDKPLLLLEPAALKKELASKGSKKMEAFAYDPLYLRLFEYLKAYHRNKKSSIGGKAEKCALLSTSLRCMGQLMEVVDPHASPSSSSPSSSSSSSPTTVFHLLEDILVYLRLVFELDPTSVVATVRQLLRCAFAVNYVSLFVDLLADQLSGRLGPLGSSSISLATSSATITTPTTANTTTTTPTTTTAFKCEHMNSLYNSCLSMPYSRLNEFYNNCQRAKGGGGGTAAETENSIGFLTWLRERTQSKLGKTLNLSSPATTTVSAFPTTSSSSTFYSPSSSVLTDSEMKSLLIAKIQLLEPLVLKSFSRYKSTNDRRFQAALAELLATLVQLQVNFCSLDTDNVFIGHVLKQFEFLENVGTRELQAAYEPLMRRLFYFLVILSNGRYISEELVDLPKVIQLCDAFIANGHHQMAVQGLAIVVDDCFYFKGEHLTLSTGGSDSVANLEATREVVLAFAFKLLDHHPQAFDLLTMIVAYYQGSSRPRWSSLSATVIELLLPKLVDPNFERLISSAQAFESLQTLLYRLCPAVFTSPSSTVTFNLAAYIFKRRSSSSKSLWRTVLFLRLIIFNLNEAECLAKTEEIRESIDYISFGGGGGGGISGDDSPAGGDEANPSPDPPPPEELLASLLLGVLQQALGELAEDLGGYRSRRSSRVELTVYLLAQYTLSLAFVFQSGFFPRVTACATQLIGRCQLSKSGGAPAAKLQPVVVVVNDLPYDFATTNELFFRLAAFHPHLTISWLNLLYITNYERLPVMLSRLIDHQQQDHHTNSDPELQNSTAVDAHQLPQPLSSSSPSHHHLTLNINAHVLRRFALVLLCDYLTENLENVEYLSWLVINHLREIVDLCYEVPVREFIHSVHRRSSSSGLFLQAVNSRCSDQLSLNGNSTTTSVDPLFASKLLHCLERAHSSQSLPLVLFLLEQYLFNAALAPYYNCSKAAEVIAASRLASLYDLNDHATSAPPKATETIAVSGGAPETPPPPKNLLSLKDLSNLRKLLRNTSYVKLSYTVQTIKNQYFGVVGSSGSVSRSGRKKSAQIRDPLTESFQSLSGAAGGGDLRNSMPEINRRWFIGDILRPYWAVAQRSTPNAVHFLDKLANEDIGELVASEHFSLVNLKQILVYLVEKAKERGSVGGGGNFSGHYQHKAAAAHLVESSNREELAKEMLAFCRRLMQYTLLRCPLQLATLLKERQFLSSEKEEAFLSLEENHFSAVAFSFLPSFEFLLRHQSLLEAQAGGVSLLSADSPEQQCLDTDLLLVYATLVPPTFRQNRLVQLTDLLTLLRSALIGNGGGGGALAVKIARPENIHVQSALIRAVYFVVEQCFTLSDEIELPAELTAFGRGSEQFERHIFADLKRVLLMFHWLEESESAPALKHRKHRKKRSSDSGVTSSAQWSSPLPPVLGRLLEELVISLAQLPFVNSLVYLPYSLFARKTGGHYHQSLTATASPSGQHSFWREAFFSGDFHTSTPIIGAQYLSNDLDLFRSFARRIELLGFVNRVQFEEIWMTLLGVYSDNLTFMSLQAKQQQPSISGERNTELNDSLQLGQLVVRSVTTLLLTAAGRNTGKNHHHHHHQQSSPVRQSDLRQNLHPHHHRLQDRRRTSKQSSSTFGDRFELIREALSRRSSELEEVLAQYNASSTTTSSSPCLQFADAWEGMGLGSSCGSRSFCSSSGSRNASSESSPTGDSSSSSAQASSNDTSVDLYSCLHFLIDLYLQTVQVLTSGGSTTTGQKDSHPLSTVCFPVFAEIGRSCLAVSELLFTEKSQYAKLLTLLHELARLVDAYEDELLNQSVIVALARTHAVLGFSDETIERAKRLVLEQHFKDFFLPTRIGAVRSVKHLLESRLLPLTTKELAPVCDYIAKHFTNEHCIPSSYSAEYVEELWSLALALVRRTSVPSLGGDFNDKVVKGLLRSLSKCGGGGRIHGASNVRSVCACLEQLLLMYSSSSNQMGISAGKDHHQHTSKEVVVAIHSAALKQLTLCTGQLNSVSLLRLYVLASYLVSPGATNFPGRQPANVKSPTSSADIFGGDDDELFSSLEQLSVIFEPLKTGQCNSLQAAALCSVLGHFLVDFFPAQDLLNKCIGEFLSNQQNHYKYLTDILFVIFNKFQTDFHHTDTAQDWVLLSLSSFTQLVPISHALWALTCFLMAASQNHWIRASYPYFQHRFGQFNERDKAAFFTICNNFYNEIKSEENKRAFIKTFQKAAASLPNSPYFDVLKYLCDI